MKPIGPLMREHRLIERMVEVISEELRKTKEENRAKPSFIEATVDFFRTYADRTHHGKEEDILFRDLAKKKLSPEHKRVMDELTEEHVFARKTVGSLNSAKERYLQGETAASLKDIIGYMEELIRFYPIHIEKEDKRFFYPCMEYFSEEEQDNMLAEFWEFDKKMIHEKYQRLVEELGKKKFVWY